MFAEQGLNLIQADVGDRRGSQQQSSLRWVIQVAWLTMLALTTTAIPPPPVELQQQNCVLAWLTHTPDSVGIHSDADRHSLLAPANHRLHFCAWRH